MRELILILIQLADPAPTFLIDGGGHLTQQPANRASWKWVFSPPFPPPENLDFSMPTLISRLREEFLLVYPKDSFLPPAEGADNITNSHKREREDRIELLSIYEKRGRARWWWCNTDTAPLWRRRGGGGPQTPFGQGRGRTPPFELFTRNGATATLKKMSNRTGMVYRVWARSRSVPTPPSSFETTHSPLLFFFFLLPFCGFF